MPLTIEWPEVVERLALAVLAGACMGFDRTERSQAAGLRTTILVCVAAAVSMIQVNLWLDTSGRSPESFAVLDMMRLPLGILSGMGFIGGGAILRRGNMVRGVTTAASLWFVTVMGLCFGGGLSRLGLGMLFIGMMVLTLLKALEEHLPRDRRARLILKLAADGPTEQDVRQALGSAGFRLLAWSGQYEASGRPRQIRCAVGWRGTPRATEPPISVAQLAQRLGADRITWKMDDRL